MVSLEHVKRLAMVSGPCLSVLQPLRDEFSQVTKPNTRLVAAAQQATRLLAEYGFDAPSREAFVRPLLKLARNMRLLAKKRGGISIFRTLGFTKAIFLPDIVRAEVSLGNEFRILPLLEWASDSSRDFWILALSMHSVKLFRGTVHGLKEVSLPAQLPRSLQEAGGFDPPDRDLENRSTSGPSGGQRKAVRFGTGSNDEINHHHIHDFFKMIDRAIRPIVGGSGLPLILAAVPREIAIYRRINTYADLVEGFITGSPDRLVEKEAYEAAVALVSRLTGVATEEAGLEKAADSGLLLTDLLSIDEAAGLGQIDRLLVARDNRLNQEVLNACAVVVIRHGGVVQFVHRSKLDTEVAAILRYRAGATAQGAAAVSGSSR